MSNKHLLNLLYTLPLTLLLLASCNSNKNFLLIYSIEHEAETENLCNLFSADTDYTVRYLRASTGEIVNRIISESNNPKANILLGGTPLYHKALEEKGLLVSYKTKEDYYLPSYAKSKKNTWRGFCKVSLGIGINDKRFKEKFPNKKYPTNWDSLLDEEYKGEIIMTSPLSSSTALLFLQNQLLRLGEVKGWEYLTSLSRLVGQFSPSGSAPPQLVGTGEYTIGIGFVNGWRKWQRTGYNIVYFTPKESATDIDCVSIIKGTRNLKMAKEFIDFMMKEKAQNLFSTISFTTPLNPNLPNSEGEEDTSAIVIDDNSNLTSKDAILSKWQELIGQ